MKNERTMIFKNTVSQKANESAKTFFTGPGQMEIGPPAEFSGSAKTLSPEEMFVAAVNGCLMNTFFYFTKKFNTKISSYNSQAEGQLEKQSDGFRFTSFKVRANVDLYDNNDAEKVKEAGWLTEKYCLVSRSLNCPVDYKLVVVFKKK